MSRHRARTCLFVLLVSLLSLLLGASSASGAASSRDPVVARWSVVDVISWLQELGLGEYAAAVEEEHVDGESLFELTPAEWEQFVGVKKLGHRKKLEKALRELSGGKGMPADDPYLAPASEPAAAQAAAAQPKAEKPAPVAEQAKSEIKQAEKPKREPYVATPQKKAAPSAEAEAEAPKKEPKKQKPQKQKAKQSKPVDYDKQGKWTITTHPESLLHPDAMNRLLDASKVRLPESRPLSQAEEGQLADLVRDGVVAHKRNDFPTAKKLYMRALSLQPRQARVLHMLGLIAMQYDFDNARSQLLLTQSLAIEQDPETVVNLGNFYWTNGQHAQAATAWARALEINPLTGGPPLRARFAETLYSQALVVHGEGKVDLCKLYLERVEHVCNEALYMHFPPDYAPPMSARMIHDYLTGERAEDPEAQAAQDAKLSAFLSSSPEQLLVTNAELTHTLRTTLADAYLHLGMLAEREHNMFPLALAYYKRCASVAPDSLDIDKPKEVRITTIHAEAAQYYGRIESSLIANGVVQRPEFQQAVQQAWSWMMRHQVSGASEADSRGVVPASPERSRNKKVVEFLHKSCKTSESFELAQLLADDLTFQSPRYPHLYSDNPEILQTRGDFERRLDDLQRDASVAGRWASGAGLEWCRFRFYLAYHGINDRTILSKLARVYLKMAPIIQYTSPHLLADPTNGLSKRLSSGGKIKVAFVSAFLNHHPVGKTVCGYIYHLPRDRFEVSVFFITLQGTFEGAGDPVYDPIKARADHFRLLAPEQWPLARAAIQEIAPDILLYPDIGMEPTTYFLAFSRLAPIQAMTFGHPDTSGIPSMDYFLSHREMDHEDDEVAQSYYTEKLVRLPGVGYWHKAIMPSTPVDRSYYGLSDADLLEAGVHFADDSTSSSITSSGSSKYTMYLVTKAVQFFSPDFMDALAGILFRHPRAFLALVMETGRNTKGYDVHNGCIDHVYDGIERRLRRLRAGAGLAELDEMTELGVQLAEGTRREARHPKPGATPYANDVLGRIVSITDEPKMRPPISGRIRFVDRGNHDYFMNLLRVADVLLQPMPLDGTTTTLEAVTMGLPTVVHRSPMVGGRMAYAIYKHMGITDTVATSIPDYIDVAVRLGTEPAFAQSVRAKLAAARDNTGAGRIFEDPAAIEAYATWMEKVVKEKAADAKQR